MGLWPPGANKIGINLMIGKLNAYSPSGEKYFPLN